MSITKNSLFLRFFLTFWLGLRSAWSDSLPGRACDGLERWFTRQLRGSVLFRFVWREGRIPAAWPASLACRLFTAIVNIPCALCKAIYRAGRQIFDGSLFCRILGAMGGATFFFLGLFLLVMLIAPHEQWNNTYGLLGAAAIAGLFCVGNACRAKDRLELDRLGPYVTLFWGFVCIGLAGSYSTGLSLRFFFFHLTTFLLVLLVVSSVRRYEQLQLLVSLAVLGISVAALYGCYQGYIGVEVVASQQDMTVNAGMPGRVYSFFDNPNNFAEQLVMLLPLELALFLNSRWRGKLLSLLALCVGVVAIGLTYGRSCWIGLALAVVVFMALMDWRWVPVLLVAGVAALPFLPETIYNRVLTITNTQDSSTQYRFEIYSTTFNLLQDHWPTGVGLGNDVTRLVFEAGGYPTNFDGSYPIHAHNNYVQMWVELGIGGVLAFLAMLLHQLKSGVKAFRASLDPRVKRMLAAAVGAFAGILLVSVAEYTWFYPRNMFTYGFLFGVIAACVKLVRLEQKR